MTTRCLALRSCLFASMTSPNVDYTIRPSLNPVSSSRSALQWESRVVTIITMTSSRSAQYKPVASFRPSGKLFCYSVKGNRTISFDAVHFFPTRRAALWPGLDWTSHAKHSANTGGRGEVEGRRSSHLHVPAQLPQTPVQAFCKPRGV